VGRCGSDRGEDRSFPTSADDATTAEVLTVEPVFVQYLEGSQGLPDAESVVRRKFRRGLRTPPTWQAIGHNGAES
jgi:hypothetical protein